MPDRLNINIPNGSPMGEFWKDVSREIVRQDDYRGIGGHGPEDHGGHGPHDQTSIGIGNTTINIRRILPNP